MTFFTFALFLLVGINLIKIALMTDTNIYLLMIILIGWGLC